MDISDINSLLPAVIPVSFATGIDWPAWVQAVGSVAAIFVAVAVPAYQHRQDLLRREEQQRSRVRAIGLHIRPRLKLLQDLIEKHIHKLDRAFERDAFYHGALHLPVTKFHFDLTLDQIADCPPKFQNILYLISLNEVAVAGEETVRSGQAIMVKRDSLKFAYRVNALLIIKLIDAAMAEFEAAYQGLSKL